MAALHLGCDPSRQLLHLLGEAEDRELDHGEFAKHVSDLEVAELFRQLSVLILLFVTAGWRRCGDMGLSLIDIRCTALHLRSLSLLQQLAKARL